MESSKTQSIVGDMQPQHAASTPIYALPSIFNILEDLRTVNVERDHTL